VIEADAGDHGNFGLADIGRIQAAAQADLQDGGFDLVASKVQQGGCGGDLEVGGARFAIVAGFRLAIQRIDGGAKLPDQLDEFVATAPSPVDLHPLFDAFHMRRGVQSRAIAGGGQHGRDHRGCRALALCPGDVDDAKSLLGIAQPGSEFPHPIQIEPTGMIRDLVRALVVDPPEQICQRGFVIHDVRRMGHRISS